MDGRSDKQALNKRLRPSCKPALACGQEPWRALLKPASNRAAAPGATASTEFAIDETEETLFALALAVEQRDRHTGGHCERLAFIGVALGVAMGLARSQLVALYRGGYLHDVGKVGIPDSILFKPGSLTAEEWVTMRSHTVRGEDICRHMKSLAPVLPIIRHHHERWDGSGYPDGLRGEQIPLLARILQIVDIYDALSSPRPYKPAYPVGQTLAIIQEETDRGWRDPRIVRAFLELHKDVISKIAPHWTSPERSVDGMRTSLANLQSFLAADMLPTLPA
ncbi:MAG: HD domain-containing protein [Acidobacteriia bacterium]|nr:HD domain-containing protein [Terriglobia bacterium]